MTQHTFDRRFGFWRCEGRIMNMFPRVWTFSFPWREQRFGLVFLADGYVFIGFFTVTP